MESILKQLDSEISKLQQVKDILSGAPQQAVPAPQLVVLPHKHRRMSAAVRAKMSKSAKLRWERQKASHAVTQAA